MVYAAYPVATDPAQLPAYEHAHPAGKSQEELNAFVRANGLTADAWTGVLQSEGYNELGIVSAGPSTRGGLPANSVEFTALHSPKAGQKAFSGHWMIRTAVSHSRIWHFSCSAISSSADSVAPRFASVEKTLRRMQDSIRLLPQEAEAMK